MLLSLSKLTALRHTVVCGCMRRKHTETILSYVPFLLGVANSPIATVTTSSPSYLLFASYRSSIPYKLRPGARPFVSRRLSSLVCRQAGCYYSWPQSRYHLPIPTGSITSKARKPAINDHRSPNGHIFNGRYTSTTADLRPSTPVTTRSPETNPRIVPSPSSSPHPYNRRRQLLRTHQLQCPIARPPTPHEVHRT